MGGGRKKEIGMLKFRAFLLGSFAVVVRELPHPHGGWSGPSIDLFTQKGQCPSGECPGGPHPSMCMAFSQISQDSVEVLDT